MCRGEMYIFFFQAEDGIRDSSVTGVQTCALPILPGVHPKGSFFTRGSGHNKFGGYTETPDEYREVMDRLLKKHKASAKFVPPPGIERRADARFDGLTARGCDLAARKAHDLLAQRGVA